MIWKVSERCKKYPDILENVSGKSKKGLDDLEVCLDQSCGIGKSGSREKSKNRKKSDKIGKIGFDFLLDFLAKIVP